MSTITATFPFGAGYIGHPYSAPSTSADYGTCGFYYSLTCTEPSICSDVTKQVFAYAPRYPSYYHQETTLTTTDSSSSDITLIYQTSCYKPSQFTWTSCSGNTFSSYIRTTLEGPSENNAAQVPLTRGPEEVDGVWESVSACLAALPTGAVPVAGVVATEGRGGGDVDAETSGGGGGGGAGSSTGEGSSGGGGGGQDLSLGAKIGIGIGAAVAGILFLAGIILLAAKCIRRKKNGKVESFQAPPSYAPQSQMQQQGGWVYQQRPVYELEQPNRAHEMPGGLHTQSHELSPEYRRWELEAK